MSHLLHHYRKRRKPWMKLARVRKKAPLEPVRKLELSSLYGTFGGLRKCEAAGFRAPGAS